MSEKYYCVVPFSRVEISTKAVFMCCSGWLFKMIGLPEEDPWEVWNGPVAQDIRRSMINGSLCYCRAVCAPLSRVRTGRAVCREVVCRQADVVDPHHLENIRLWRVVLDHGPQTLVASNDPTCNLRCPSCREGFEGLSPAESRKRADVMLRYLRAFRASLRHLKLQGNGDPFASRMCGMIFNELNPREWPELRIEICTNGQLLMRRRWEALGDTQRMISSISVSVDAASAETYALTRVGGSWPRLMENLEFMSQLRQQKRIDHFGISMVVQAANWRDMPGFVEMGRRLKVDSTKFTGIRQWQHFSDEEFQGVAVQLPSHPEHAAFRELLRNPIFDKAADVDLADLGSLQCRPELAQALKIIVPDWSAAGIR